MKQAKLWVAILGVSLFASGCLDGPPSKDDDVPDAGGDGDGDSYTDDDGALITLVGSAGAIIASPEVSIIIPAGAVEDEVELGVRRVLSLRGLPVVTSGVPDGERASGVHALTPHGTRFQKEVTLELVHDGTGNAIARLEDENDKGWEIVPGADFGEDKVAKVPVTSFSLYVVVRVECPEGVDLVDGICVGAEPDIDPCGVDNGGCGDPVFTECQSEGAEVACVDIDECAVDNGGCGDPQRFLCENLAGRAPRCSDVDPCAFENGGCGDPVFTECQSEGAEVFCVDIDECAIDNGSCGDPRYRTCSDVVGAAPVCGSTGIFRGLVPLGNAFDFDTQSDAGPAGQQPLDQFDVAFTLDTQVVPAQLMVQSDGEIHWMASSVMSFDSVDFCIADQLSFQSGQQLPFGQGSPAIVIDGGDWVYQKVGFLGFDGDNVSFEYASPPFMSCGGQ